MREGEREDIGSGENFVSVYFTHVKSFQCSFVSCCAEVQHVSFSAVVAVSQNTKSRKE